MSSLKYLFFFLVTAVVALSAQAITAQNTAPVRGVVKMQSKDGTQVPVADALVEPYRTDLSKGGALPAAKTNKKGEFTFISFQLGYSYALAVSGTGISPVVQPNIKAGQDNVVIIASEGDGRKPSEEDVRAYLAKGSSTNMAGGSSTSSGANGGGGKAAAKSKEQEELEKKNAEINEKNNKIKEGDEVARKANQEGVDALKAKNWDVAIAKFDEGVTAVPDFVGSTPILLDGKVVALKSRGFDKYHAGAQLTDLTARRAKYDEANSDYDEALKAFDQAMAIIKAAPAAATPAEQKQRDSITLDLLSNAMEVHRLKIVPGIDTTKIDQASAVVTQYVAAQPDEPKKLQAKITLGDMYRNAGQFDKAVATYKEVLEASPDNQSVMASLGLSLVALGTAVDPPNKDQLQEGLNYMQKYADTVQILPTDSQQDKDFKQSVKDTVEYLKTEQKLKAQPPAKTAPKKKG